MLHSTLSKKLTLHAKKSLRNAEDIAHFDGAKEIRPFHLLYAIRCENGCVGNALLTTMGLTTDLFEDHMTSKKKKKLQHSLSLSEELKLIITTAYATARELHYPYVGTEHLIYALLESDDERIQKITEKITDEPMPSPAPYAMGRNPTPGNARMFDFANIGLNEASTADSTTPHLDQYCTDLSDRKITKEAPIIGRTDEMLRMMHILARKNKNNPLLLGEPGVGKTAIVVHLAQIMRSESVPHHLHGKRILALDLTTLIAGTSFRGEFETRIKEVIREAIHAKNVILFIDELHTLIGAGNVGGTLDAANILKPALARGQLRIIGATTFDEYKKHVEKDAALARRFQKLIVAEPSITEAKKMLWGTRKQYEQFHHIIITKNISDTAVDLSVRYFPDRFLPDKAIDVIDEAAARVRNRRHDHKSRKRIDLEHELKELISQKAQLVRAEDYDHASELRKKEATLTKQIIVLQKKEHENTAKPTEEITLDDLYNTIATMTGMPQEKITDSISHRIMSTDKLLSRKVIGQKEALTTIKQTLIRSFSGVANTDRPLGSFLFLGPTGVGKTMTAKLLAQDIFDTKDALIRVDMSEFMERHNIAKLIGAPAGYIGYGEGGTLTEKVRRTPHAVVLFDEIEKAHPDVLNVLLQILEEGHLTDAEGRTTDFSHAIIILTSNIGTAEFSDSACIGFGEIHDKKTLARDFNKIKHTAVDQLKKQMKPELINRLDHIIVFQALDEKEISKITRVELNILKKRLRTKKILFSWSPAVVKQITKKSISFHEGARAVRRTIQDHVEVIIAEYLITHEERPISIKMSLKKEVLIVTS